jgi:hypothetical protein
LSKLHLEARRWLKSHRKTHPFLAVSAVHERFPGKVDCISRETAFMCMTWAFRHESDRDFFVANVETAERAGTQ